MQKTDGRYSVKTYGADTTNSLNERVQIAFNAESEAAARQYLEERGFFIRSLYVIPRTPGPVIQHIPQRRVKIEIIDHGIRISIPISQEKFIQKNHFVGSGIGDLSFWLVASTIIGILGIGIALDQYYMENLAWWLILSLCGWFVGEVVTLLVLLVSVFGSEKIILSPTHISIGIYLGQLGICSKHPLQAVEGLQRAPLNNLPNKFVLNYQGRSIPFGHYITDVDADAAYTQLRTIVEARCHTITDVLFGSIPDSIHAETLAVTPDVSELQFPYVQLQHIHIDVETCNIYQVEQFLTYAINVIGRKKLKEQVTAHLYDPIEQLRPNIYNNLTLLCREVVMHAASYIQEHQSKT